MRKILILTMLLVVLPCLHGNTENVYKPYSINCTGDVTADTFYGDGSNLTGISAGKFTDGDVTTDDAVYTTGDVGIGTTSPNATLHIENAGAGHTFVALDEASPDTTPFVIDSAGDVGIGTGAPSQRLHVLEENTITNNFVAFVNYEAKSTGDALNGFGPAFTFRISDTGVSASAIATIGSVRDGADNSGKFFVRTGNAGSFDYRMVVDSLGNVGIGTTDPTNDLVVIGNASLGNTQIDTNATNVLLLADGNRPTTSPTDSIQIFAVKDATGDTEAYVRDSAGNETVFSPHKITFEIDPNDLYPFAPFSQNPNLGLSANLYISGALRDLEKITGKTYVFYSDIPQSDWITEKRAQAILTQTQTNVLVDPNEAVELYEITEVDPNDISINITTRYEFIDGNSVAVETETETQGVRGTGVYEKRIKAGYWLDPDNGNFYRKQNLAEAEAEVDQMDLPQLPSYITGSKAYTPYLSP